MNYWAILESNFTKKFEQRLEEPMQLHFFHTGAQKEPTPDSEQTNSVVEEMVDIAKPLNLEEDGDDAQELLGAHRFTRS